MMEYLINFLLYLALSSSGLTLQSTSYCMFDKPDCTIPPIAELEANVSSGSGPLQVNFNGSNSFDEDGIIVQYDWDYKTDDHLGHMHVRVK